MSNGDIDPNELADTYEALTDLHDLVTRVAEAREAITGESDTILHSYAEVVADQRAEYGNATRVRNPFTMAEYRAAFDGDLPTIQTSGLTDHERTVFFRLGIIDREETFRIPHAPVWDDRLPVVPESINTAVIMVDMIGSPEPAPALTLFHVSDTHLGYENRAMSAGGATTRWVDRVDSVAAFGAVVERAIDVADLVVHTGDLFDHEVDEQTLDAAVAALERLAANDIPFYYIFGDHDRLATGEQPERVNAVNTVLMQTIAGPMTHATPEGQRVTDSELTLFGVDATGVGPAAASLEYDLANWSIDDVEFDTQTEGMVTGLCLHDVRESGSLQNLLNTVRDQGVHPDLVCCGHAHTPPFDGDNPWHTIFDGVEISCAGPTIPVSSHFDDQPPGYTRIEIGTTGEISVRRESLSHVRTKQ